MLHCAMEWHWTLLLLLYLLSQWANAVQAGGNLKAAQEKDGLQILYQGLQSSTNQGRTQPAVRIPALIGLMPVPTLLENQPDAAQLEPRMMSEWIKSRQSPSRLSSRSDRDQMKMRYSFEPIVNLSQKVPAVTRVIAAPTAQTMRVETGTTGPPNTSGPSNVRRKSGSRTGTKQRGKTSERSRTPQPSKTPRQSKSPQRTKAPQKQRKDPKTPPPPTRKKGSVSFKPLPTPEERPAPKKEEGPSDVERRRKPKGQSVLNSGMPPSSLHVPEGLTYEQYLQILRNGPTPQWQPREQLAGAVPNAAGWEVHPEAGELYQPWPPMERQGSPLLIPPGMSAKEWARRQKIPTPALVPQEQFAGEVPNSAGWTLHPGVLDTLPYSDAGYSDAGYFGDDSHTQRTESKKKRTPYQKGGGGNPFFS